MRVLHRMINPFPAQVSPILIVRQYTTQIRKSSIGLCFKLTAYSLLTQLQRHSRVHSWSDSFMISFTHACVRIHSLSHLFALLFNHSFMHAFIHSLINSFIHSNTHARIHSLIYSLIHLLTHSLIDSFIHSLLSLIHI